MEDIEVHSLNHEDLDDFEELQGERDSVVNGSNEDSSRHSQPSSSQTVENQATLPSGTFRVSKVDR